MLSFFSQLHFGQAKQALDLREHRATHGPEATLGPYGPPRDWPPKAKGDAPEQAVPGAPAREAPQGEGGQVDPVTGEALAPLRL
jgi:hypothetical protein